MASWNDRRRPAPQPTAAPQLTGTVVPISSAPSAYIQSALNREALAVANAPEGTRNDALNRAAFSLGTLVGANALDQDEVVLVLAAAARTNGLPANEAAATIRSGINSGVANPRTTIPEPTNTDICIGELDWADPTTDTFFDTRPVLAHIRDFAHSRMTAPWAVLAGCLLRAAAATPPHIVTPPIIGGVGSLNLLCALVGPSGAGKGASEGAAADALTWPLIHTAPLGSGEGITHAYAHPPGRTKKDHPTPHHGGDNLVWEHTSVLFTSPEIDQVTAISNRRGSTLMPQLRSAYSGERLGFQYADSTRRIILPAHQYRFNLSVGVQPDKADAILNDADGGTPQRFLWLPVTDPTITANPAPEPDPWLWVPILHHLHPDVYRDRYGHTILPIPDTVTNEIRQAHAARARGDGDALDGHSLYTRLKVAHCLAILDQKQTMDETDWELAGIVMHKSDVTRTRIQARLTAKTTEADERRARKDARRQSITEDVVAEEAIKRVTRNLGKKLEAAGSLTDTAARHSLASRDRHLFTDVVEQLVTDGSVTITEGVLTWTK